MDQIFSYLHVDTVVTIIVGALIVLYQFRSGTSKISTDTIEAYKSQVELYEKRLTAQNDQIQELGRKVGEMTGMINSKDQQIEQMRKILENRNPELEQVLKQLTGFMESVDKRLTEGGVTLGKILEHQMKPVHVTSETHITKQP